MRYPGNSCNHQGLAKNAAQVKGFYVFTFGIEHEVVFLDRSGQFSDYVSASFDTINKIIARLPLHKEDYPQLLIGDAGIRVKRWYMEGLERFDAEGHLLTCLVKGIEIRTSPHQSILGTVEELSASFQLLTEEATRAGFIPVLTSFHPYRTEFVPDPPFNAFEEELLHKSPEDLSALLSMLTYGPDLNISCQKLSAEENIDIGRKFTYYSPYIVGRNKSLQINQPNKPHRPIPRSQVTHNSPDQSNKIQKDIPYKVSNSGVKNKLPNVHLKTLRELSQAQSKV